MRLGNLREVIFKFDWIMMAAVMLLFCLGLAAIYSIGLSAEVPDFSNFKKQIIFGAVGLLAIFVMCLFNYSAFRVYSRVIYIVTALLLLAVLFFGQTIRGTTGWFAIGNIGFQPVEAAKIALIIFLARFFANRFAQFNQLKHIAVSFLGLAIYFVLILLQPDLGSAFVLFALWFGLLLLTKVKVRYILVLILLMSIIASGVWFLGLKDYQKDRILTFVNPQLDPLGSGYNVTQSIIAVGSGQILGRGLGFGSQSQLKFIPESETDFVFAVIAEEMGFLGVSLMMFLWVIIFSRLIRVAKKAKDDFGMFVILGVCLVFFIHLIINIGMNIGIIPVTGISLPFLSSGGSFLIASFVMIGLAQSVLIRR